MDPKATACAEFDYWKSIGRSVKRGEKGIPLLDIDSGRIKYIFDIRQTVSINHNISEVKLWKYDSKKHLNLLDDLIDKFKEKDSKLLLSQEDKIDALVESNVRGKFNKILESLSDESLKSIQKVDLFNLLKESVKISISERIEVSYQLKEENLSLLSKISSSDIDKVLSISANISKNILLDLGSEIKRLEILEKIQERKDLEQTKELKERYNKLSSDINGKINFKKGGLEDERESNIGRQGIPHGGGDLHTNRQGEFLRETYKMEELEEGMEVLIPNMAIPKEIDLKKLNRWGRMRLNFLKENKEEDCQIMYLQGTLMDHLLSKEKEIEDFITREEVKMMETWGLTEELKEENYLKYLRLKKNMDMTLQEIGEREIILI